MRPDRIGRLPVDLAYASGNAEMVALLEPLTYPDASGAESNGHSPRRNRQPPKLPSPCAGIMIRLPCQSKYWQRPPS